MFDPLEDLKRLRTDWESGRLSIFELLESILPCIDSYPENTELPDKLAVRSAILHYFYNCAIYSDPVGPSANVLIDQLEYYPEEIQQAIDRLNENFGEDPLAQNTWEGLDSCRGCLETVLDEMKVVLDNHNDLEQAIDIALASLRKVFDWERNDHLQAYVFLVSSQLMSKVLTRQEKFLFMKAIEKCVQERIHERA